MSLLVWLLMLLEIHRQDAALPRRRSRPDMLVQRPAPLAPRGVSIIVGIANFLRWNSKRLCCTHTATLLPRNNTSGRSWT